MSSTELEPPSQLHGILKSPSHEYVLINGQKSPNPTHAKSPVKNGLVIRFSGKKVVFDPRFIEDDVPAFTAEVWDWPLQGKDGQAQVDSNKDKFQVALQMGFFSPKEIQVKVCGQDLVIYCRHDESADGNGFMSRTLWRSYHLPADVDLWTLRSALTNRGILHITADKLHK